MISSVSAKKIPKVSIGMPIYNSEKYLVEAIESILQQTYVDFELIISDNCSNDSTEAICSKYASDSRVKYYRQKSQICVEDNFKFVFEKSIGRNFMWAADDDLWSSDWIKNLIYTSSEGCLSFGVVQYIDSTGGVLKSTANHIKFNFINNLSIVRRVKFVFSPWLSGKMILMWGVFPRVALEKVTSNISKSDRKFGADVVWVYNALKTVKIVHVSEAIFYKRVHCDSDNALTNEESQSNLLERSLFQRMKNFSNINLSVKNFFVFYRDSAYLERLILILCIPIGYILYVSISFISIYKYKIKK